MSWFKKIGKALDQMALDAKLQQELNEAHEKKKRDFAVEGDRLQQIIHESIKIVVETKNIKTALSRLDTIRDCLSRLLEIIPSGEVSIKIPNLIPYQKITDQAEFSLFTAAKDNYVRKFYNDKINLELLKADSLSDNKLKATQFKKALKVALNALDYLPNDSALRTTISDIESRISATNSKKPSFD